MESVNEQTKSPFDPAQINVMFHVSESGNIAAQRFYEKHKQFCEAPRLINNEGQAFIAVYKKGAE